MEKIVFLSCTKSKTPHPAPAQELYSASPMFQKTLAYGKSLNPDRMYILSAKHHLVPLGKKLAPYDLTLKEMPKDEKDEWGKITFNQIKSKGINPEDSKFIFLAGDEYIKPLLPYIPAKNVINPMKGKRFGERLKWLNSKVDRVTEILKILKEGIMKMSKDKLLETFKQFKNDLEDYGTEEDMVDLEDLTTPLTESEGDITTTLKEICKTSPRHRKMVKEFLNYLKHC